MAITEASLFDTAPEGRGRRRFTGCKTSLSISFKSLKIYSALETQQNEMNDKIPVTEIQADGKQRAAEKWRKEHDQVLNPLSWS